MRFRLMCCGFCFARLCARRRGEQKRRGERRARAAAADNADGDDDTAAAYVPPFFVRARALPPPEKCAPGNRRDRRHPLHISMAPVPTSRKRSRAHKKEEAGEEQEEGGAAPPEAKKPTAEREPKPTKRTKQGPVTAVTHHSRRKYHARGAAAATERARGQMPIRTPRVIDTDADANADDSPVASPSASAANTIDALLERKMREIVAARVYPSTACPSEVPRRLVDEEREAAQRRRPGSGSGGAPVTVVGGDWRALMEPCREVARRLAREGALQITQRGRAITDLDAPLRGPIRLRPMMPSSPPS